MGPPGKKGVQKHNNQPAEPSILHPAAAAAAHPGTSAPERGHIDKSQPASEPTEGLQFPLLDRRFKPGVTDGKEKGFKKP